MTPKLGDPANLLSGFHPRFPNSGCAWHTPTKYPLIIEDASVVEGDILWHAPEISFHDSLTQLAGKLFDYKVRPMRFLDGPLDLTPASLPAYELEKEFATHLGLNTISLKGRTFLLVCLRGERQSCHYTPEIQDINRRIKVQEWRTEDGLKAQARLRLERMRHEEGIFYGDIKARNAQRYLDYFQEFGTHLVSKLTFGDSLYQVFVIPPENKSIVNFSLSKAGTGPFQGMDALPFKALTQSDWIETSSPILSAQQGRHINDVISHPAWLDDENQPPSLLSVSSTSPHLKNEALNQLSATGVISVEFSCQALYLENHRADVFTRLLRGSLDLLSPSPLKTGWMVPKVFNCIDFLKSAELPAHESLCVSNKHQLPAVSLAIQFEPSERIQTFDLAFYASTLTTAGLSAEIKVNDVENATQDLKLLFPDSGLQIVDDKKTRAILVEGAWLRQADHAGCKLDGTPLEVEPKLLRKHQSKLHTYLEFIEKISGPAITAKAAPAFERVTHWISRATENQEALTLLHWHALKAQWGFTQWICPSDASLRDEIIDKLSAVAQPPHLQQTIHSPPPPEDIVTDRLQNVIARLGDCFSTLADYAGFNPVINDLARAGKDIGKTTPPPQWPPQLNNDDSPQATMWNSLLCLRAMISSCRALQYVFANDVKAATNCLKVETVSARDCKGHSADQLAVTIRMLLPPSKPLDDLLEMLQGEIKSLSEIAHATELAFHRMTPMYNGDIGPQLRSLMDRLDALNFACRMGVEIEPLDSLSPPLLLQQLRKAKDGLTHLRQIANET